MNAVAEASPRLRILRCANTPFFLLHLLGSQMRAEIAAGHEVYAAAGDGDGADELRAWLGDHFLTIPIARDIAAESSSYWARASS